MKKVIFFMLFATMGAASFAQINQIASVSGSLMFSGSDAYKYYTYIPTGNAISIYNWNGSLYKMISVTPPSGYSVNSVTCLSKKCINNDDKLEMCVIFSTTSSTDYNTSHKMWLINEDGTKLNDFGNAYSWSSGFVSYDGATHLNVTKMNVDASFNVTYTTIIYSCSGSGVAGTTKPHDIDLGLAYPNPAANTITLPYKLTNKSTSQINIYDANGRLYTSIPVGMHFNEVKVDVSTYPAGVYFYECEGISYRFVVQ